MEIKSEFELQEEVYVIGDTNIPCVKIKAVRITVDKDSNYEILYGTTYKEDHYVSLKDIFKTKNDAKNYLLHGEHTKYDKDNIIVEIDLSIGDNVWFMRDGHIYNGNVSEIRINMFVSNISHNVESCLRYIVNCSGCDKVYEFSNTKNLYNTKEDLMCSL